MEKFTFTLILFFAFIHESKKITDFLFRPAFIAFSTNSIGGYSSVNGYGKRYKSDLTKESLPSKSQEEILLEDKKKFEERLKEIEKQLKQLMEKK